MTLDHLPQDFVAKARVSESTTSWALLKDLAVRPVLARPTQAMPAAAAAATPTGASSITTHRAGGTPSGGGDEKDLRIGLASLHVAAGNDRVEPLPHAQPIDRRFHILARGR